MVLLGGRAAEEIIFGKDYVTTGAYSDLKHSTNMITSMLAQYGMGESLGLLSLSELSSINYTPGNTIVDECRDMVNSLYELSKTTLLENKTQLDKLAEELLDKETLLYDDIIPLLN